jgi:hypothetical protein
LAASVATGRVGVKVKEVQSLMANEKQSVQAVVQPAAATGSMLDPLMDGERLLPRHMIAVEDGDANLQLNRLVAAIKTETEESLSTLELRLAELTAAIKRRSDVELALSRARLTTAEAELSEFRAAKQAPAEDARGGTFGGEAGKPEKPLRRRTGVREGGRPLQRWL